jgi:hypothetical protein
MKFTKQYLEENISKFTLPIIPIKGVTPIDIRIVSDSDINVDNRNGQVRNNDNITKRIDRFTTSFAGGIDFSKPLPILELRSDGKYDLTDGFGRHSMISNSGQDYYIYAIVKCETNLARTKLRTWCNRKTPKDDNSESDLVTIIINSVYRKELDNNESAIREFLDECEPHLDPTSKARVYNRVFELLKTQTKPKKTWTFSDKNLKKDWIDRHWESAPKYGFSTANTYNINGGVFQMAIPYGYEGRKLVTIMNNYHLTGKKTEVILHVMKGVDSKESLNKKRKLCLENINKITNAFDCIYGKKLNWNDLFELKGFVPQSDDEPIKKLIPINEIENIK